MRRIFFHLLVLLLGMNEMACRSTAYLGSGDGKPTDEVMENNITPAETVVSTPMYKGSETMLFDIQHTKLELSFDFQEQHVLGKATIELRPWFYPQTQLTLDARGFDIHDIQLLEGDGSKSLGYAYDKKKIKIELGRVYTKDESLLIKIDYTAKPHELEVLLGTAITSDQGLYFINSLGSDPRKPVQIWTQGETTSNSNWFPTIDAPNQRCTQEMFITVPDSLKTLSNGILVYSQINPDSTRTDYWSMDLPHAPYLFMLAVGNYEVIEDEWEHIKLQYYVEPQYAPHAKKIFGRTPAMMDYFSRLLDYPFPWPKYAQVVVRDFVTGAMENTTASVFMEEVQSTSRELIDYNWDDIIAHELFHQWFGDLVTCESWANITLNEAFATYAEVLWLESYKGHEEAQYKLMEDLEDYMDEAQSKKKELIRFYHDNPDNLFDNHSYAKGGLILHLLRSYIGDDAFFGGLKYYLRRHAYSSVEVHDLRMAFEHITGEDLNWFFNQWFLASGHPVLRLEQIYNDSTGTVALDIWQDQDSDKYPVYRLPLSIDIWCNGVKTTHDIVIDELHSHLQFVAGQQPELIVIDNRFNLIGEIEHQQGASAYYHQYLNYTNVKPRIEALEYFAENPESDYGRKIMSMALEDPFWRIRQLALIHFERDSTLAGDRIMEKVVALTKDENSSVRADALSVMASVDRDGSINLFREALKDSSYMVAGVALENYIQSNAEDIPELMAEFLDEQNINIVLPIADYLVQEKDYERYGWFEDKISGEQSGSLWYLVRLFGLYLLDAPDDMIERGVGKLKEIGLNHDTYYVRISAYQSLELLAGKEGVTDILATIRAHEKDPRVVEYFNN